MLHVACCLLPVVAHCMSRRFHVARCPCCSMQVLPVVPMFHAMAWGIPYCVLMTGCKMCLASSLARPPAHTHEHTHETPAGTASLAYTLALTPAHTRARMHACAQVPHLSLPHARRDRSVHRRPRRHDVWRSPDYLAGALARLVCQSCSGTDNAV